MKVLLDTNIVLDLLLERELFVDLARDKKGFKKSEVNVVSPKEFLALMKQEI